MDSYETIAIFAANEFPPLDGGLEQLIRRMRKLGWGQQTTARQVWDFVGLSYKLWFGRKSIDCSPLPQGESRSVACKPVLQ